jgi:hypothetical protein
MQNGQARRVPPLLWPLVAPWRLLAALLKLTGRVVGAVIALALMTVGLILCFTGVGLPLGIPLAILGLLLVFRSIF